MARKSNTEARRTQIVNALHSLLGERGYDGSSIQVIAHRAGLAPGLVHYHFANKEEILLAVVEHLANQLDARMRDLGAAPTPAAPPNRSAPSEAWRALDAWIDAHLALGAGARLESVAAWVAIGAEALRKPAVRDAYEAAVSADLERGTLLVAAVLRAQSLPDSVARSHTVGLLAAIEGCYRLAAAAPNVTPTGFAAPTVRAMARGLLGGPA
ncbi:MAG: TetR/AcrR family transcriptional regulator [Deltaproteobacteria bacterium]|nr:TetR/AcrR family transcriptional regulator [Deltaproteobacteria bacterium]